MAGNKNRERPAAIRAIRSQIRRTKAAAVYPYTFTKHLIWDPSGALNKPAFFVLLNSASAIPLAVKHAKQKCTKGQSV